MTLQKERKKRDNTLVRQIALGNIMEGTMADHL